MKPIFKKVIFVLVFGLMVWFIVSSTQEIFNSLQASKRLDRAASRLAEAQKRNGELKGKLAEARELPFIEIQIRDKLNLARPNESVFLISDSELKKVMEEYQPKLGENKLPNWQSWLKLFLN